MNPEGLLNKIITGDENALRQLLFTSKGTG